MTTRRWLELLSDYDLRIRLSPRGLERKVRIIRTGIQCLNGQEYGCLVMDAILVDNLKADIATDVSLLEICSRSRRPEHQRQSGKSAYTILKRKTMEFVVGDQSDVQGFRLERGCTLCNEENYNPRFVDPFKVIKRVGGHEPLAVTVFWMDVILMTSLQFVEEPIEITVTGKLIAIG
ncbi:hypothetical protein Tco_1508425 [Tanacetum coccineum]|uniref:Uncharacterized protein n=1 Tax=Tanacetum coccineum TaxID=301880 RepID=A0ABQ5HF53_9ASTR